MPFVKRHVSRRLLVLTGIALWAVFCFGRVFGHGGTGALSVTLELLGMNWLGALFLTFVSLVAIEIMTGVGFLLPRLAPSLRGLALVGGGVLSVAALVQGLRPPVMQTYEVHLAGLPSDLDGTVIVGMSDLHIGSLIGEQWLAARVAQVRAEEPDLVVLLGDLFEGHGRPQDALLPILRRLRAPMGVWAILGNHESHHSVDTSNSVMDEAGFRVLRNRWVEVRPGLVLAGVEDLRSSHQEGKVDDGIARALEGRPPGATILLSHRPLQADRAASAGAGLMLCGHTHGGQIWPFSYLVRHSYPLFGGLYHVGGMAVIVCRGTGTWGPRMRLWHPGEILRVTLRSDLK